MNIGFSYYFRNGMSNALHALKGESFAKRFSLLVYFIMSFIGKLFFFTRPIFAIADINLAQMVRECQSFSFAKIFQNTSDGKRYKNLLLFYFLFDLGLLVALAILLVPTFVLWGILVNVDMQTNYYSYSVIYYITMTFTIVMILAFIFVAVSLMITYAPVGYVAANARHCDVSDYLYNAKKGMKGMKWTYFLINLVYFLIIALIFGIIGGSVACLMLFSEYYTGMIIALIIILAFVVLVIYFLQIFFLGLLNSTYLMHKSSTPLDKVMIVSKTIEDEDKVTTVLDEQSEPDEESEDNQE